METLFIKRGLWGFIIAIPVAIVTHYMWGAPFAGISFMAEITVLTLIRNSKAGDKILRNGSILIYDFIYNALIGAPFYYLTYTYIVKATRETTLLLAQKSIVNGVMNSLIAYVIYAAITLYLNKRYEKRQTVSLQALSLATVYSVIVFITLFMSDKLYGSVMQLKAESIFNKMEMMATLVAKASTSENIAEDEYGHRTGEAMQMSIIKKMIIPIISYSERSTQILKRLYGCDVKFKNFKNREKVADGKNSSLKHTCPNQSNLRE